MEPDLAVQTLEGYFECKACGRRYRSFTIPERCAVCGAASARAPRRDAEPPRRDAQPTTEKFRLAAERAKGNFRS